MLDWLKPLLMMFYAPARGMAQARDRAPLGAAALVALVAGLVYEVCAVLPSASSAAGWGAVFALSVQSILSVGLFFVPLVIFVANLFERRGSFRVVVQQEYAALASAMFYGWAAASIAALPLAALARAGGVDDQVAEAAARLPRLQGELQQASAQADEPAQRRLAFESLTLMATVLIAWLLSPAPLFVAWAVVAVREVFRFSWPRAAAVVLLSGVLLVPTMLVVVFLFSLFSGFLASPFLLLLMFFLLRGYFGEVVSAQRARASFRQNLEAATLNPADASAHYNLGLIHLSRRELAEARSRFQRAVEIDSDEVDSHYQLGRISRMENRLPEAIEHFGQVVTRDEAHAQHEVWREIGATYLDAAQHADALDALERFLSRRSSDPEALYLKGRALAGVGRRREAAEAMRECIEAVKTAPAYKYRTDKRWLNEAQQFLRSQA
jgi:tetratricopeptide (TPR) repeat protein